jgi:hypothetical protein
MKSNKMSSFYQEKITKIAKHIMITNKNINQHKAQ